MTGVGKLNLQIENNMYKLLSKIVSSVADTYIMRLNSSCKSRERFKCITNYLPADFQKSTSGVTIDRIFHWKMMKIGE